MHFKSLTVLLLGGFAAAQTIATTTTAPSSSETSLPDLVGQIDSCVLDCIKQVSPEIGCSSTDFDCLCATDVNTFRSKITSCVTGRILKGCDIGKATQSAKLIDPICQAVRNDPNPSDVASASKIVQGGGAESTGDSNSDDNGDSAGTSLAANSFLALVIALMLV